MFDVIHEFAVLGTTFFMMAVHSIWYSQSALGRYLSSSKTEVIRDEEVWKYRARLFGIFLIAEGLLAYALVVLREIPLSPINTVLGCVGVYAAITSLLVIEKRLSLREYLAHAGFFGLWLISSLVLLYYWPW